MLDISTDVLYNDVVYSDFYSAFEILIHFTRLSESCSSVSHIMQQTVVADKDPFAQTS